MAKIVDWDSHIGRRLRLRDLHVFFMVVQHGSLARLPRSSAYRIPRSLSSSPIWSMLSAPNCSIAARAASH
jgi:hypothetical protein